MLGEGGTGKSWVLKAINEFARRWHVAGDIVTTATSGVAACLINGMTWQKSLGVGIRYKNKDPTNEVKSAWQHVILLIVDELSMLACGGLGVINNMLQRILGNSKLFGGIHILLTGDMGQLCAGNQRLWLNLDSTGDAPHPLALEGSQIWKEELNTLFHLVVSKRMENDQQYASDMHDLRERQFTKQHILRMRTCLADASKPGAIKPGQKIIVPCNDLREDIAREVTRQYGIAQLSSNPDPSLTWRQRGAIVVDMTVHRRNTGSSTSLGDAPASITSFIHKVCPEKSLKGMPGQLCFILGETYSFATNICVMRGMAKSMWVTATDLVLSDATAVTWNPVTGMHHVSANDVEMAIVTLQLGDWGDKKIFDLDALKDNPGQVPVEPIRDASVSVPVRGYKMPLQFTQLPLVLVKAMTCHKAQVFIHTRAFR